MRIDRRKEQELRPVFLKTGFNRYAEGSVEIHCGQTIVHVTATVEERVPPFIRGTGKGWVTAEYNMLPRATETRNQREGRGAGGIGGRTHEIQRLIGRSLRAVMDLEKLGERTITLDCDVLQADGGTRTASITASWVALVLACQHLRNQGLISKSPIRDQLAAVSVGLVRNQVLLDLCYQEDAAAEVDMNVVMTGERAFVEVQATGEEATFQREQLDLMLKTAEIGIETLFQLQNAALKEANISWSK